MNNRNRPHFYISVAVIGLNALLTLGCAGDNAEISANEKAPDVSVSKVEQRLGGDKPGIASEQSTVISAKVTDIDKKNRVVTLQFPDGKENKLKCGPEVKNFAQIKVGDNVVTELFESSELFVTTGKGTPSVNAAEVQERAPLGNKPGRVIVDSLEITATVVSINYETREVILKNSEGKTFSIVAGPEVKRLAQVNVGDMLVARLTAALSIKVVTAE